MRRRKEVRESRSRGVRETRKPGSREVRKPGVRESRSPGDKKKEPVKVSIDFERIAQRILALPIPARNFIDLKGGKEGMLYLLEGPTVAIREGPPGPPETTLHKYDLTKRKFDKVMDGVNAFEVSNDGEKMLIRQQQRFVIAKA